MKKFTFLALLVGLMVGAHNNKTYAQKAWVSAFRFYKTIAAGNVPHYVQWMDKKDSHGIFGLFASMDVLSPDGQSVVKNIPNLNNTVIKNGNDWIHGGNILPYLTYDNLVLYHDKFLGNDYVATEMPPHFLKLNTQTKTYEPYPGLTFSSTVKCFFPWTSSEMLIAGSFAYSGGYGGQVFWNPTTNKITPITGNTVFSDFYYSESDETLMFSALSDVRMIQKGSNTITVATPTLPCHFTVRITAKDKNTFYMIVGQHTPNRYELYRFSGGVWTLLAVLNPTNYLSNSTTDSPIEGFFYKDGILYIAGQFNAVDGQPRNGVVAYNEATDVSTNLAPLPTDVQLQAYISGLYLVDNELYLATQAGQFNTYQTTYVLRDVDLTPPIVPTISGSTGKQNSRVISGVITSNEPNISNDVYVNSAKVQTVQSDASGKSTFTYTAPSDGIFSYFVKSRDAAGNVSAASSTLTVSIKTVAGSVSVISPTAGSVWDKGTAVQFSFKPDDTATANVAVQIAQIGSATLKFLDTISTVNGSWAFTRILSVDTVALTKYEVSAQVLDSYGNTGASSQPVSFYIKQTIISQPRDSSSVGPKPSVLYPNPTTNGNVTITNARGIISITRTDGKRMKIPKVSNGSGTTINLNISFFAQGLYFIEVLTKENEIEVKKVIVGRR